MTLKDTKLEWGKFYYSKWRSDPLLRLCGMAARGLWIEMICLMHEASPRGYLTINKIAPTNIQIAGLTGCPSDQIDDLISELESVGVFSRNRKKIIYSRHMVRAEKRNEKARSAGKMGGNPALKTQRRQPKVNTGKQTGNSAKDNPHDKGGDKGGLKVARAKESRVKNIESYNNGLDSTPATAPGTNNVGGEVDLKFLCNEVLRLTGLDQRPAPVATGAIDMWLSTGLSSDQIIAIVAEYSERKRNNGETISSLNYFRDIMTKAAVDAFDQGRRHDAREGALGQRVADMSEITWRSAVTKYGETGNWSRGGWGEPPGHPDCMVPEAIKTEFTDLFKAEGDAL